jgi:hypothetical protein
MPTTAEEIRAAVEQRFAQVARSPGQEQKFPVGPASAKRLGYDPLEIDALSPSVTESFCGVGNPLGLGDVRPGQTVLDLGSGAGLDSLLAAWRVGPTRCSSRPGAFLALMNPAGRIPPQPDLFRSGGDHGRDDRTREAPRRGAGDRAGRRLRRELE